MLLRALPSYFLNALMIGSCKLNKYVADYMQDPSLYRSVVGELKYAALSRPEISFAINSVCQISGPTT